MGREGGERRVQERLGREGCLQKRLRRSLEGRPLEADEEGGHGRKAGGGGLSRKVGGMEVAGMSQRRWGREGGRQ